jgi:hypothetical protein
VILYQKIVPPPDPDLEIKARDNTLREMLRDDDFPRARLSRIQRPQRVAEEMAPRVRRSVAFLCNESKVSNPIHDMYRYLKNVVNFSRQKAACLSYVKELVLAYAVITRICFDIMPPKK